LIYVQRLIAKKLKYEVQLSTIERNEKESAWAEKKKNPQLKLQGILKKLDEIPFKKIAADILKFIDHLKRSPIAQKMAKKYLGELVTIGGQIVDISRGLLLL
jgi:hypothetical protein